MTPRLVILESPYAGDIATNERYARACMADSLGRGEAPLASHLLYTQPGVLDDNNPVERDLGIAAGFAWGNHADATVVYIDRGISNGMIRGIDDALAAGRAIEMRRLPNWEDPRPHLHLHTRQPCDVEPVPVSVIGDESAVDWLDRSRCDSQFLVTVPDRPREPEWIRCALLGDHRRHQYAGFAWDDASGGHAQPCRAELAQDGLTMRCAKNLAHNITDSRFPDPHVHAPGELSATSWYDNARDATLDGYGRELHTPATPHHRNRRMNP